MAQSFSLEEALSGAPSPSAAPSKGFSLDDALGARVAKPALPAGEDLAALITPAEDQPKTERKVYTGSVFDTQPFDPKFNPEEAARLSRRDYAEREARQPRRTQSMRATPSEQIERTVGQAIADTGIGLLQGAAGIPKGIAANINAGDNPVAKFYEEAIQAGERAKSPFLQSQKAEREALLKNVLQNQGELAQTRAAFTSMFSPSGADVVAQGAGSMLPTVGMSLLNLGQRAFVATNALANAGEAAQNTARELSQMSPEKWSNSDAYQELRGAGLSHADAVRMLAPLLAMPSQLVGGVAGGAAGATGLEKSLAGKGITGGARERGARAGAELLGEQVETLAPSFAGNVTQRMLDEEKSLTEGLGREAVETLFGATPGAALAATGRSGTEAPRELDTRGLADRMARERGFLTPTTRAERPEPVERPAPVREKVEPTFDEEAFVAPTPKVEEDLAQQRAQEQADVLALEGKPKATERFSYMEEAAKYDTPEMRLKQAEALDGNDVTGLIFGETESYGRAALKKKSLTDGYAKKMDGRNDAADAATVAFGTGDYGVFTPYEQLFPKTAAKLKVALTPTKKPEPIPEPEAAAEEIAAPAVVTPPEDVGSPLKQRYDKLSSRRAGMQTAVRDGVITDAEYSKYLSQLSQAREAYEAENAAEVELTPLQEEAAFIADKLEEAGLVGFARGMRSNIKRNIPKTPESLDFYRNKLQEVTQIKKQAREEGIAEDYSLATYYNDEDSRTTSPTFLADYRAKAPQKVRMLTDEAESLMQQLAGRINAAGFKVNDVNPNTGKDLMPYKRMLSELAGGASGVVGREVGVRKKYKNSNPESFKKAQESLRRDIETARTLLEEETPPLDYEALSAEKAPVSLEVEENLKKQRLAAGDIDILSKRSSGTSLMKVLEGSLNNGEISELIGVGASRKIGKNPFASLMAKKGTRGSSIEDVITSGKLDPFLPFKMRSDHPDHDDGEAAQYIREKLLAGEFYTDDIRTEIENIQRGIWEIEKEIEQELSLEDINREIQYAVDEQRELDQEAAPAPTEGAPEAPESGAREEEDLLKAQTKEELKAKQDEIDRLSKENERLSREAERKAKADEEAGDFVLTGSKRDADKAAARGQKDIFAEEPKTYMASLQNAGFTKIPRGSDRAYKDEDGKEYSTLERDGVRVVLRSGTSLQTADRGEVEVYQGDPNEWTIQALIVDPESQGKGLATEAMQEISDLADEYDIDLYLQPTPIEGGKMSKDDLASFYGKFGFNYQFGPLGKRAVMFREAGAEDAGDQQTFRSIEQPKAAKPSIAYHSGDLGFGGDTVLGRMMGGRSTGHFGTGVYFVGDTSKLKDTFGLRKDRPIQEVDFGKYNLFKPSSNYGAEKLHGALRKINSLVEADIEDKENFKEKVKEATRDLAFATDKDQKEVLDAIRKHLERSRDLAEKNAFEWTYIPTLATEVMQELGYEGIDVRGLDKYDNLAYGSVIYGREVSPDAQPVNKSLEEDLVTLVTQMADEMAQDEKKRSPSLVRTLKTYNRQRNAGKMSEGMFIMMSDAAIRADEERRLKEDPKGRERGYLHIQERLSAAVRRGELPREAFDLANWFMSQNENLVADLGISIKGKGPEGAGGFYNAMSRVMTLIKDGGSELTATHEILHHLERMMPAKVRQAIRKAWLDQLIKAFKATKDPVQKLYFEAVLDANLGDNRHTMLNPIEGAGKAYADARMALEGMAYGNTSAKLAETLLLQRAVPMDMYQYFNPSEFWAVNGSRIAQGRYEAVKGGVLIKLKNWLRDLGQKIKSALGLKSDASIIRALDSLNKGDGKFQTNEMLSKADNYAAITGKNVLGRKPLANWTMPDATNIDAFIYKIQNKQIDMKDAVGAIKEQVGEIDERFDPYMKETLFSGRAATQTKRFLQNELEPLFEEMGRLKVSIPEFEEYLHNRHAKERNLQIAIVNPGMPDKGSGISDKDADDYFDNLSAEQEAKYERLAGMVDAITSGTRQLLVDSGLESQDTINKWEETYENYIPLNRDDIDYSSNHGMGVGQGYSVRGPASRRAVGSERKVVDILANIAMQRERNIVRAEKNRVAMALYGMAIQNPNPSFFLAVNPDAKKDIPAATQELVDMGFLPSDIESLMKEPSTMEIDPSTGLAIERVHQMQRGADNVMGLRVNGENRYVFFNQNNERAKRMATALKNLDADQLGMIMSTMANATRFLAAMNTQYNPIFGAYNFLRDVSTAGLQLTNTPLAGKQTEILKPKNVWGAMHGIYTDLRAERGGKAGESDWSKLWEEFQQRGGQTGFRDQFSSTAKRGEALQRIIDPSSWADSGLGKVFTAGGTLKVPAEVARKAAAPIFNWLSDYNETMENAIRLSAYKAAIDPKIGNMSKDAAAVLAKELTVNFNRKGQIATQAGALYAFFNASVQGTTALAKTIAGPAGKRIIAGGLMLGGIQAVLYSMAGFDEGEPPEFVREKNFVIPIGNGKYIAIPLPLGYNVIPNTARLLTQDVIRAVQGKKVKPAETSFKIFESLLSAFNPIGNAGWSFQTFAPTLADPFVALGENRDYTGKKIAREDFNSLDPTPGFTRYKESSTAFSRGLAEFMNSMSGGDKDAPGKFSPTPDQIDYLIGQIFGGVGREAMKIERTVRSQITGEELPPHAVPFFGRFYGDTKGSSAVSNAFYENLKDMNIHENTIKGMRKRKENVQEYFRENPEARMFEEAGRVEREIQVLRKRRRELVEKEAPKETVKAIEERITARMKRFNDKVKQREEKRN